jgi:3-oxoacyl-[acyl-carrier-protein] synthase-3
MFFELNSDGSGQQHLIVPAGGFRHRPSPATRQRTTREAGNIRSDEDLYMDGAEIFTFTLREVPHLIRSVMDMAGWQPDDVDAFVLHQANRFMLQHVAKRARLPAEKMVYSLEEYGNTSSASIPMSMMHGLAGRLRAESMRLVLAGFGVGLSWAGAAVQCGPLAVSDIITIVESKSAPTTQET